MKQEPLAIKQPVHELKTEHGKLWVYRLKPPQFKAAYQNEALTDVDFKNSLPVDNKEALFKKAIAFTKRKLQAK